MEIDIKSYLDDAAIADIVKGEVRKLAASWAKENIERVLNNAAYDLVFHAVDDALDGTAEEIIKAKALQVIDDMSAYDVFRPANVWDREASKGWTYRQKALDSYSPIIFQRVREAIENYPDEALTERVAEMLPAALCELVKKGAQA